MLPQTSKFVHERFNAGGMHAKLSLLRFKYAYNLSEGMRLSAINFF